MIEGEGKQVESEPLRSSAGNIGSDYSCTGKSSVTCLLGACLPGSLAKETYFGGATDKTKSSSSELCSMKEGRSKKKRASLHCKLLFSYCTAKMKLKRKMRRP